MHLDRLVTFASGSTVAEQVPSTTFFTCQWSSDFKALLGAHLGDRARVPSLRPARGRSPTRGLSTGPGTLFDGVIQEGDCVRADGGGSCERQGSCPCAAHEP